MAKQTMAYDDESFDFGFTTVSEIDLKKRENQIAKQVHEQVTADVQTKVQKIYKMIMPLLQNLKQDAETQEYIYWPNRAAKIDEFIAKLESVVNG